MQRLQPAMKRLSLHCTKVHLFLVKTDCYILQFNFFDFTTRIPLSFPEATLKTCSPSSQKTRSSSSYINTLLTNAAQRTAAFRVRRHYGQHTVSRPQNQEKKNSIIFFSPFSSLQTKLRFISLILQKPNKLITKIIQITKLERTHITET